MSILTKALRIATEKVLSTIFNIVVFRNVYSLIQMWLSGIYAFIAVIYITPYVKGIFWLFYSNFRSAFMPKKVAKEKLHSFDKKFLKSTRLNFAEENDQILKLQSSFLDKMKIQSQIDLFSYIFMCSSKSALLNLVTIIGVEYVHSNYEYNIVYSIFYCVSITFVICFGASLRYSSILSQEWLDFLNTATSAKKITSSPKSEIILMTYEKEDSELEFVCMWVCDHDSKKKCENVELKFLSSTFAKNLKDLIEFYATNHLVLKEKAIDKAPSEEKSSLLDEQEPILIEKDEQIEPKKYNLFLPDYYDDELVLSKFVKSIGFKGKESWKEFNIFPLIDVKVNAYTNVADLKNDKKKTN